MGTLNYIKASSRKDPWCYSQHQCPSHSSNLPHSLNLNLFHFTSVSTTTPQSLISSASSTEDTQKWMEHDEKAYGIIQDHISDALLIKTRSYKTAKALFDALIEIHQMTSLPTTFYTFWQLFASTWDGTSSISDHITSL